MIRNSCGISIKRFFALAPAFAVAALAACLTARSEADGCPATVEKVEEKWRLVLNEVDPRTAAPQVSTQMASSPQETRFCNLHLNSCDLPHFTQGGLQLQVWNQRTNLAAVTSSSRAILSTRDEVITWTQYVKRDGGTLKFGIEPGAVSQTWGDFGGIEVAVPGQVVLDNYSPNYSVDNSGITLGANRVTSLELLQVRLVFSDGTEKKDDTRRVVYPPPGK